MKYNTDILLSVIFMPATKQPAASKPAAQPQKQPVQQTAPAQSGGSSSKMMAVWIILGIIIVGGIGFGVWYMTSSQSDEVLESPTDTLGGNGALLQDEAPVTPPPSTIELDEPPLATEDIEVEDFSQELSVDLSDLDDLSDEDQLSDIDSGLDELGSL